MTFEFNPFDYTNTQFTTITSSEWWWIPYTIPSPTRKETTLVSNPNQAAVDALKNAAAVLVDAAERLGAASSSLRTSEQKARIQRILQQIRESLSKNRYTLRISAGITDIGYEEPTSIPAFSLAAAFLHEAVGTYGANIGQLYEIRGHASCLSVGTPNNTQIAFVIQSANLGNSGSSWTWSSLRDGMRSLRSHAGFMNLFGFTADEWTKLCDSITTVDGAKALLGV